MSWITVISMIILSVIYKYAEKCNESDANLAEFVSDDKAKTSIVHARQDIKLICFLLSAIIILLAIIADRME